MPSRVRCGVSAPRTLSRFISATTTRPPCLRDASVPAATCASSRAPRPLTALRGRARDGDERHVAAAVLARPWRTAAPPRAARRSASCFRSNATRCSPAQCRLASDHARGYRRTRPTRPAGGRTCAGGRCDPTPCAFECASHTHPRNRNQGDPVRLSLLAHPVYSLVTDRHPRRPRRVRRRMRPSRAVPLPLILRGLIWTCCSRRRLSCHL
jgi:hypothetical protein